MLSTVEATKRGVYKRMGRDRKYIQELFIHNDDHLINRIQYFSKQKKERSSFSAFQH